jgi:photosystem II stability/assembly factor-like uncharacterized protein
MKTIIRSCVMVGLCALALAGWSTGVASAAQAGWTAQTSGTTQSLKGVSFLDNTHGFAVGANGTLLATTDGQTWTARSLPTTQTLWAVLYWPSAVFVAGDAATAFGSQNGGQTWGAIDAFIVTGADLHGGMAAPDGRHALGVGSAGTIVATDDGGQDGAVMPSGTTADLWAAAFTELSTGWVVGDDGTIIHTVNGAYTWSPQTSGTSSDLYSVAFANGMRGWVVGQGGTILTTANSGASWEPQTSGTTDDLFSVAFADVLHGWIAGDHGTILVTTDGGTHWTKVASGTTRLLRGIDFVGSKDGWAIGDDGTILATTTGGIPPDSTPPTTTSDADAGWHNADVTVHLSASDGPEGSGIVFTEFSTDNGDTWTEGTVVTVSAPADHTADGVHAIQYNSKDLAGNLELPKTCHVNIDTTAPSISPVKPITVKKGKTASINLRIDDMKGTTALSPTATVVMTVKDSRGKVKRVVNLGVRPTNQKVRCTWKCTLKAGSYTYSIAAVDAAGNPQVKAVTGKLMVK